MDPTRAYDLIIVGGGTAGLVLANRLTEDPKIEVLVIEAGQNRNTDPKVLIPGLATTLYDDPLYDWSVSTVPQGHLNGKSVRHGRGKVLGGSSAINILALTYPSRASIDAWATLGNSGWNWAGLEAYYKKFHTFTPPSAETSKALSTDHVVEASQGTSGPIHGSFPEHYGPLSSTWIKTFERLGLASTSDPLSGNHIGGYITTSSIQPGKWERSHAGNSYYEPVASRQNLHLITECMVEKLSIENRVPGEAVVRGVLITQDQKSQIIEARKEVLLCAGVFQSPQLLELSGIGNPEILQKHGIDVLIANTHVGENLQDHPLTGMSYEVVDDLPTIDMIRDPKVIQDAMTAYTTARQGPLTSGFHSCASIPLVEALKEPGRSEMLQLFARHLSAITEPNAPSEASQYAAIRSILEDPLQPSCFMAMGPAQAHPEASTQKELFGISDPHNYLCILLALTNSFSRGNVHIKSSSVHDYPAVDPRYLSHPLDAEILARHLQWIPTLATTKPLADYIKPSGVTIPRDLNVSTLEAAKEHLKKNIVTFNHPCGSCAMMSRELGGVVDDRLRVYGVRNLRVVDASVFPMIPNGTIQSTVYAVAEKAADIIKEDLAASL